MDRRKIGDADLSRRQVLQLAGASALGLLLPGCGGGGNSHSGSGTGTTSGTGSGTPPLLTNLMDPVQRGPVMAAISTALSALPVGTNGLQNPTDIANALSSISGVSFVQIQFDGCVGAQFSDGLPFTIINNRPTTGGSAQTRAGTPYQDSGILASHSVPASGSAILLDFFYQDPGFMPANPAIATSLSNAGYGKGAVAVQHATVEVFRGFSTNAKEIGLVYIATHGGMTTYNYQNRKQASNQFGLLTATPYLYLGDVYGTNAAQAQTYANYYVSDLSNGSLALASLKYDSGTTTKFYWYYMLMPNFISNYHWNFSNNSLVYLNVCSTMSNAARPLLIALFTAHASVIAGWTDEVENSDAYKMDNFMFAYLLGDPQLYQVPAPVRAYSFNDAKAKADQAGLTTSDKAQFQLTTQAAALADQFTALVPSVMNFAATSLTQITLLGEFGVPGGQTTTAYIGSAAGAQATVSLQLAPMLKSTPAQTAASELVAPLPSGILSTPYEYYSLPVYVAVETDDGSVLKSNIVTISNHLKVTLSNVTFDGGWSVTGSFDYNSARGAASPVDNNTLLASNGGVAIYLTAVQFSGNKFLAAGGTLQPHAKPHDVQADNVSVTIGFDNSINATPFATPGEYSILPADNPSSISSLSYFNASVVPITGRDAAVTGGAIIISLA